MINQLYISSFIFSGLITILLLNDLKNINNDLYDKIYYKIYFKLYILINIVFIHLIWLFNVFLTNNNINYFIYGLPVYLIIPYFLLPLTYINSKEKVELNKVSKFLDKLFFYLFLFYFIGVLVVIIIPNKNKKDLIDFIIKILNVYVFYPLLSENK